MKSQVKRSPNRLLTYTILGDFLPVWLQLKKARSTRPDDAIAMPKPKSATTDSELLFAPLVESRKVAQMKGLASNKTEQKLSCLTVSLARR